MSFRSQIIGLALLGSLLLAGAAPSAARADGGYIYPPESFLTEPIQQALLQYDSEAGVERLTIQPGFAGDAAEFAWLVPVPGLPTVEAADRYLFGHLERLTGTRFVDRDGDWDCLQSHSVDYAADSGVTIISQALVGYYDTMILAADEASALYDSLQVWGYLHAGNEAEVTALLSGYVADGWSFVALRVDTDELAALGPPYGTPYYGAALAPVRFTFAAAEPVYPMRISALSASDVSEVHLYVAADHRMTFPGADTYYANRITDADRATLRAYPALDDILVPGTFLTRLFRGYRPAEMTADIVLQRAPTDDDFRLIRYSGMPWTTLLLLGPPFCWLAWRLQRQRHAARFVRRQGA